MNQKNNSCSNQTGAVLIIIALSLVMIVGFAALSVDVGRRVMVGNEVQNAVDAGALAGARALIVINPVDNSTSVDANANNVAIAAVVANFAAGSPAALSNADVKRGHWTFDIPGYSGTAPLGFSANTSTAAYNLTGADSESLNGDPNWINAIQVKANTASRVGNFFARIFGDTFATFNVVKDAVGYRGFAGRAPAGSIDMPIAICSRSIEDDRCNIGRMFPNGDQTARWTDFTQEGTGGCQVAGQGPVLNMVQTCTGNPTGIDGDLDMSTTNGTWANVFNSLEACFFAGGDPSTPGPGSPRVQIVTLPVIDCEGSGNCRDVTGFVKLDIVWVKSQNDPNYDDAPVDLLKADGSDYEWQSDPADFDNGTARWNDFADYFALQDQYGDRAEYPGAMQIYFKPNCEETDILRGVTGEFYGILSETPVLVE